MVSRHQRGVKWGSALNWRGLGQAHRPSPNFSRGITDWPEAPLVEWPDGLREAFFDTLLLQYGEDEVGHG